MKELSKAFESCNGRIFHSKEAAFQEEYRVKLEFASKTYFGGSERRVQNAIQQMDVLMQDLIAIKTLEEILFPESSVKEEEELPY